MMAGIKLDQSSLKLLSVFESVTHVPARDCFPDLQQAMVFVVSADIGRAVGRGGANVRHLEQMLKRKIKIVEFNPDLKVFVQNVIQPLKLHTIDVQDSTLVVEAADGKTRGLLIGRSAQNLRNYEYVIKRYFDIKELKAK